MQSLFRAIYVFMRLLPFVVSFVRDYRSYAIIGQPIDRTEADHRARARDLTRTIAGLGPTFIKGIQVLAVREDILPRTYTEEFKTLQDRVPPFPVDKALHRIEVELGRPASLIFERFDHTPLAAASIGQVHRARHKGREVIIKILRPGIEELVGTDLAVIGFIINLFETFADSYMVRSFRAVYREFARVIGEEMDYRNEQANADILRRNFAHEPRLVIPRCIDELTTQRVVAFEFLEGVRIDDLEGVQRLGGDTSQILGLLTEVYLRMTLVDGFIHADPHPGNIIVLSGGRVALVDFGMAVEIDARTREEMLRLVFCIVNEDVDGVVEIFYRLRMVDPEVNRATLVDAAETLMSIQLRGDATPRQIQEIAFEVIQTFYKFPLRMPEQLVYLSRAAALIEGIGFVYDPRFNAIRFATPIVLRLLRERPAFPEKPIGERLREGRRAVLTLAKGFYRAINRIERDDIRFRLHQGDVRDIYGFATAAVRRILVTIGAIGVALWGAVLYMKTDNLHYVYFTAAPAAILIGLAFILPLRRRPPGRRFPFL